MTEIVRATDAEFKVRLKTICAMSLQKSSIPKICGEKVQEDVLQKLKCPMLRRADSTNSCL